MSLITVLLSFIKEDKKEHGRKNAMPLFDLTSRVRQSGVL
jgi:hypothetical protein